MKAKILIAMIALNGCCSYKPVKTPSHFQVQQYRDNKMRYPNLYPLTVKEQFAKYETGK